MAIDVAKFLGRQRSASRQIFDAVEAVRAEIRALADRRRAVEGALRPRTEAVATLDEGIAAVASRFNGDYLIGPLVRPTPDGFNVARIAPEMFAPALCAFVPGAVREHLLDCIDARYENDDAQVLTDTERAAALDQIDDEALRLALAEEAAIRAAETAGVAILRRADLDPRAALAHDDALPS